MAQASHNSYNSHNAPASAAMHTGVAIKNLDTLPVRKTQKKSIKKLLPVLRTNSSFFFKEPNYLEVYLVWSRW